MNWRNGVEKDIDEVLQIPYVFTNASKVGFAVVCDGKGIHASKEDLLNCFGTADTTKVSRIILDKGTEQISGKERDHQLQTFPLLSGNDS